MLVDDEKASGEKELVYDARKDIDHEDSQKSTQKILRSTTENHRRTVGLDRAADNISDVPGAGHQLESFKPVAESGHGGDARGLQSEKAPRAGSVELTIKTADRKEPAGPNRKTAQAFEGHTESQGVIIAERSDEKPIFQEPPAGRSDHESALRSDERLSGGRKAGGISQDLLQVGETWQWSPVERDR
jgi:hypothetical protein